MSSPVDLYVFFLYISLVFLRLRMGTMGGKSSSALYFFIITEHSVIFCRSRLIFYTISIQMCVCTFPKKNCPEWYKRLHTSRISMLMHVSWPTVKKLFRWIFFVLCYCSLFYYFSFFLYQKKYSEFIK